LGAYNQYKCTNAFIYLRKAQQQRILTLDAVPGLTCVVDGHVFFELEGVNYESTGRYMITNGGYSGSKIVDYNISGNRMQTVELLEASVWKFTQYGGIYRPRGQTNILHFHYNAFGDRLTEGRDYPEGSYILDVQSGEIRNAVGDYDVDERYLLTAYDGRRIIFLDGQDTMSGLELVSTEEKPPYGKGETITLAPGKYKLLHSFSKSFNPRREDYVLHGMSPDRHYALVMKTHVDKSSQSGYIYSYYLVDVTNGNTRLILNNATGVKSKNTIEPSIYWVDVSN
jgi:hypothetical protein